MRILVFGDSIAAGFWDYEGGWVARLNNSLVASELPEPAPKFDSVYNLSVSGQSTHDLLDRFSSESKARKTDDGLLIVFASGNNDARFDGDQENVSKEDFKQNVNKLLDQAKSYTEHVLWVGPVPVVDELLNPSPWEEVSFSNGRTAEYNEILKSVCSTLGVDFIDVFEAFSSQNHKELLQDGLHPNHNGHLLIYELVKPAITRRLR